METKQKAPSPIAWALGQTGERKGQYVLSVFLAIVGVAFSVAPYFVVVGIVQGLMEGNKDLSYYLIRCLIIAAFWLGRVLFHALSTTTSHKATFAVLGEIRKRCTEKLTRMPLGAVLEQSSGALKNTLIERIDSIETTLAHIVPEFTANLLIPIIILVYIFTIDWRMGLASLATVPLGMFCYVFMMAGSAKFYQHTVTATKTLNDTAVEYIGGIQVIKVFGKTKSSYDRFVHDAYEASHSFIDWMRASIIPFTFHHVNLTIPEKSFTALVGPSGSGKSTIAKLVGGFWDVTDGSVRMDGKDLRSIPLEQLYDQVAYVSQDNWLFDDSIMNNIRMGKTSASDAAVREAAKASGCDEFIRALPDGYETKVGSGGARLSGGERQRIAIARAMLKDAPIVILDEATAYIDPENEAVIQRALTELMKDKTVIIIAHRLSTVTDADQIVLINKGSVECAGTHSELLTQSALYNAMWQAHISEGGAA